MTLIDRAEGHTSSDVHNCRALGSTPRPGQSTSDTQFGSAGATILDADHRTGDIQICNVGVDSSAPDQRSSDIQAFTVGGNSQPLVGQALTDSQGRHADGWLELRIWCEQLEDAMAARIAATNRAERGGVNAAAYKDYLAALTNAEHICDFAMKRCYRRVVPPEIVAWQKSEKGLGEKLIARLLGHLGDPCVATPHHWEGTGAKRVLVQNKPYQRSISQLWQYAGVGDPGRRKHKGMTAEEAFGLGNPMTKMLMRLNAEACIKTNGHYRDVYDDARDAYADRVHAVDCVRCGPSGKPALEGSPWSLGHQHAAALRKVAKEILRDLWRVRHAVLCPPTTGQSMPIAHPSADSTISPSTNCIPTSMIAPSAGILDHCPPTITLPSPSSVASADSTISPPTNQVTSPNRTSSVGTIDHCSPTSHPPTPILPPSADSTISPPTRLAPAPIVAPSVGNS